MTGLGRRRHRPDVTMWGHLWRIDAQVQRGNLAAVAREPGRTWYERVQNPGGGPDLLRTDKEDLTLATASAAPVSSGEVALSTVPYPIYQTNPNQDPVIAACYMGDYNQIASNGSRRFVSWGDNRNVVTTAAGVTENQADVFLQRY